MWTVFFLSATNLERTSPVFCHDFSACCWGGVTIVCRRSEGFFWWSKVVEQFIKSGISAEQLRVQQIGEEALRKTIQSHELTSIVLDGGVEHFEEVSREIYNNQYSEREMIKIITPHDCPQVKITKLTLNYLVTLVVFCN